MTILLPSISYTPIPLVDVHPIFTFRTTICMALIDPFNQKQLMRKSVASILSHRNNPYLFWVFSYFLRGRRVVCLPQWITLLATDIFLVGRKLNRESSSCFHMEAWIQRWMDLDVIEIILHILSSLAEKKSIIQIRAEKLYCSTKKHDWQRYFISHDWYAFSIYMWN